MKIVPVETGKHRFMWLSTGLVTLNIGPKIRTFNLWFTVVVFCGPLSNSPRVKVSASPAPNVSHETSGEWN